MQPFRLNYLSFLPQHPTDVDYRVMATFTEMYTTLFGFINFRLYQTLNLVYPPKVTQYLDLTCIVFITQQAEENGRKWGGATGSRIRNACFCFPLQNILLQCALMNTIL
jgi:hypothetical protein